MNFLMTPKTILKLEETMKIEIMALEVLDSIDNQLMRGFGSYLNYEEDALEEVMEKIPTVKTKKDAERFLVLSSLVEEMLPDGIPEMDVLKASIVLSLYGNSKTYSKKEIFQNPYLKNIKINNTSNKKSKYNLHNIEVYKGEIFTDNTDLVDGVMHIPHLGYCRSAFYTPAIISETDKMAHHVVNPEKINIYQPIIDEVKGDVLCLGLEMGYFAYMASLKENVEKVTIVENDTELIELFVKEILPQIENKDKIELIDMDPIMYLKKVDNYNHDYCVSNISQDPEELILAYLRVKKMEKKYAKTKFLYYDEDRILLDIQSFLLMELLNDYQGCDENEIIKNDISKQKIREVYRDVMILNEKTFDKTVKIESIKEQIEKNI